MWNWGCRRGHHGNAEVSLFHQDNAPRDKYDAEYIGKLRAECSLHFWSSKQKMSLLRLVKKRKKLICVVPRLSSGAGLWQRYRAAIVYAIIVVCLREFYAKPYSALEEKKSPCFVKFRSIFRTAAFVIVILPSALGIFFRGGTSFRCGSPIMLLCSLYLIDEVLAIILFYRSEMTDGIGNPWKAIVKQPQELG